MDLILILEARIDFFTHCLQKFKLHWLQEKFRVLPGELEPPEEEP